MPRGHALHRAKQLKYGWIFHLYDARLVVGVKDKRILLGVSGGIAAYKSADLVRRLRGAGAQVQVVMTRAGAEFITPLTMQALSGRPVPGHFPEADAEAAMGHITLARWADLVLVAPASADFMARLSHGLADDLLTALCLAAEAPLLLAPAMNQAMWRNPATRENRRILQERGVRVLGPGDGAQACGETGPGRMLEAGLLMERLAERLAPGPLTGTRVLVTAGPTREPIDPVRFVGNRSSGKMGYAVAAAAREWGADVVLVSGRAALPCPAGVERVWVDSAREMYEAVLWRAGGVDLYIGAAAVADYRPVHSAARKIKKSSQPLELRMEPTEDILASVAALPNGPFTVGVAAQTERVAEQAREKRARKRVDMMAANLVGAEQGGFERDENALRLFWRDGECELPLAPKGELARQFIAVITERYLAKRQAPRHLHGASQNS